MKKLCFAIATIVAAILFSACNNINSMTRDEIAKAEKSIQAGNAECILLKQDGTQIAKKGGGISPALYFYDNNRKDMKGAVVVDKVVGRAVAAVFISAEVRHVHGLIISEDAMAYLKDNGIPSSGTLIVPRILNRKRDGICPMELSVEGISDPDEAIAALRAKIASMQKHSNK